MRLLENIHNYDVLTFGHLFRICHRARILINSARAVSFSADGPLYGLIGLCFLFLGHWPVVKFLALGFLIERIAYKLCKSLFKRNRPADAIPGFRSIIMPPDQFSFPSGHTSAAFLMAGCMTYFFFWAAWALYIWASCVAVSRILLGLHFPTDALAGAVMGTGICLITSLILF